MVAIETSGHVTLQLAHLNVWVTKFDNYGLNVA